MNNQPLALAVDIGTQSMRVSLVNKDGSFLDMIKKTYDIPYLTPVKDAVEQTPTFYYDTFCEISRILITRNQNRVKDIVGLTTCCFRDSAVVLDENMNPLRNIILWLDQRKAKYDGEFGLFSLVFRLAGMMDTAEMQFEMTPWNRLRKEEPEVWAKTKHYVMLPAYMNYLMTGNLIDSVSGQTGHMPVDYKNRKWLGKYGINTQIVRVPLEMVCPIVATGDFIGEINEMTHEKSLIPRGLPVYAGASDKACETLGLSVNENGKAAVSLGTAVTIDLAVDHYFSPYPFLPSYPSCDETIYNPELQIYRGFWMLRKFIEKFDLKEKELSKTTGLSVEELLNKRLDEVPIGSKGILVQPYWQPGIEEPHGYGAILGFHDESDNIVLYRAIIEGLFFSLRKGLLNLEKRSKTKVKELYVSGGGSQSKEICQILSDLFGLPVIRSVTTECSSLGAGMIVFRSAGIYATYAEAINNMYHEQDRFVPNMKNHAVYDELYRNSYAHLLKAIRPINESLFHFNAK